MPPLVLVLLIGVAAGHSNLYGQRPAYSFAATYLRGASFLQLSWMQNYFSAIDFRVVEVTTGATVCLFCIYSRGESP